MGWSPLPKTASEMYVPTDGRGDHHGRRGRCQLYADQTICTFLMLKGIFNLILQTTQGLLDSLFELMNVPLCTPRLQLSASGPAR